MVDILQMLKTCSLRLSSVPFWIFRFVVTHSTFQLFAAIFWLSKALLWSMICHSLHSFHVQFVVKFIGSVICHSLHSVCVQWVIKWTKISLACIVVLQDPMCQAPQRQAKTCDIRCRILFDCQFPMLCHVFDSLALWRHWSRQVPSAKLTRTQGFHLRLRLRCRASRDHSLNTSEVQAGSACQPPALLSTILRGPFKSSIDPSSAAPQEPAAPADEFRCPRSVSSMFSCGFTAPEISDCTWSKWSQVLHHPRWMHFCCLRILLKTSVASDSSNNNSCDPSGSPHPSDSNGCQLWLHAQNCEVTTVRTQKVSFLSKGNTQCNTPVVLDTGASFSLTPFKADFVTPIVSASSKEMKGIADSLHIQGVGTVSWPIRDDFDRTRTVTTQTFHVPDADIRLFSPQRLFQEHQSGRCVIDHLKTSLESPDGGTLEFPCCPSNNLPLMFTDQCEQVGMATSDVPTLDKLEAHGTVFDIIAEKNANSTAAQKELLLWHFRLGHAGMGWVWTLMRNHKAEHGTEAQPPIPPAKHDKAESCDKPCCEACHLGKQHRRTPGSVTVKAKPEMEMAICQDNLMPGDCISLDQFESSARGRLPHTFGKESSGMRHVGGLLGIGHSSGYVFL